MTVFRRACISLTLADQADTISLSRCNTLDLEITTKPDHSPVSDADKPVERAIIDAIAALYATNGVVGEEFGSGGSKERYRVIDPIDLAKNFRALYRRWYATTGGGAFVVEGTSPARKLTVLKNAAVSDASIAYSVFQGWGDRRPAFER
jgi:histidinol-phosphatase